MNTTEKLAELRKLQTKADAIRRELGITSPGQVIYQATLDTAPGDTLLVQADGLGGATTSIVQGNYPVDYIAKFEKFFQTEAEAEAAAEELTSHHCVPGDVLAAVA